MHQVTIEDSRRHALPADAPESWQESFFLGWYDPATRSGGHHHISIKPKQDHAHVWSWLVVGGVLVGRAQQHRLPVPDGDYGDLDVGTLRVRVAESLRDIGFEARFGDDRLMLDYRSLCPPHEVTLDTGGLTVGKRHYESMGIVTGTAIVNGETVALSGGAWHDHSWGPRQFYPHRAGRWVFAVFGDDLAISVFTYMTPQGPKQFGWVFDDGVVRTVTRADFAAVVADDGLSPVSCEVRLWVEGFRGYHLQGHVDTSILTGDDEWYSKDGLAAFTCGGRLGAGIIEVNEQKSLNPAQRRELEI